MDNKSNENMKPWYAKLSKVASLVLLVFVLVYVFILRLHNGLVGSDVVFILVTLLISALLGNLESK